MAVDFVKLTVALIFVILAGNHALVSLCIHVKHQILM